MPKTVKIAKTTIDDAINDLKQLPAKTPSDYSLKEAIRQILPVIKQLTEKGYNLDEISQLLTQKNIAISSVTLKLYLREFAKSTPKKTNSASKPKLDAPISVSTTYLPASTEDAKTDAVKQKENSKPKTTNQKDEAAITEDSSGDKNLPYKSPPKPGSEHFK